MIYLGIDPGKAGGIGIITETEVVAYPFSDEKIIDISEQLGYNKKVECYVENVHAMPGQGVTSMFNFGKNFGFILGCLRSHGIEPNLVSPIRWKRYFQLGADKKESIQKCKEYFPEVNLRRTPRCTTDSDGMAEALLIAEYGKEENE